MEEISRCSNMGLQSLLLYILRTFQLSKGLSQLTIQISSSRLNTRPYNKLLRCYGTDLTYTVPIISWPTTSALAAGPTIYIRYPLLPSSLLYSITQLFSLLHYSTVTQGNPQVTLKQLSVIYQRHISVVYSLFNPKGLTLRICLFYNLSYSYNYAL